MCDFFILIQCRLQNPRRNLFERQRNFCGALYQEILSTRKYFSRILWHIPH